MSLVAYGDSSGSEEENELVSESGKDKDIRKLLSVLPAPVKGKKNQPVRIGLPSLSHHGVQRGSDSEDSDDEKPSLKRTRSGGTGLTALLPQPKQASKIVLPIKTATKSETMVPYTLSKRAQAAAARQKRGVTSKHSTSSAAAKKDDSDSDEEPVSFFSHLESTDPLPTSDPHAAAVVASSSENPIVVETAPSAPKPFSVEGEGGYDPIDPLLSGWGQVEGTVDERFNDVVTPIPSEGPLLGAGPGLSMDDQAYRRLMGGKRKRGRDPSLNDLIEIKEDDVKVGIELYQKHFSEESVDKLYKPPEGEKPTSQQKRKNQISYLAHQAKANELKLLKQWGQSAASRRDTQMKYGF